MRQISISGLNTGVINTVSAAFDISDLQTICALVSQASGNIAGAIITVEKSFDGSTNWTSTGVTIAAAAMSAEITISTQFFRLKVTTNSVAASTANIIIQGKDGYFPAIQNSAVSANASLKSVMGTLEELQTNLKSLYTLVYSLEKQQNRSIQ